MVLKVVSQYMERRKMDRRMSKDSAAWVGSEGMIVVRVVRAGTRIAGCVSFWR